MTIPNPEDATPLLDAEEALAAQKPSGMRQKLSEQAAEIAALKAKLDDQTATAESNLDALTEKSQAEKAAEAQVAQEEIERLRAAAMTNAYQSIGLDEETGIGKAAAITYDGEPDGLAEYVEAEFGHTYAPDHPMAVAIAEGQTRLDALGRTAGSIGVPTQADTLAKAEAEGDYSKTLEIKSQQIARMFRP